MFLNEKFDATGKIGMIEAQTVDGGHQQHRSLIDRGGGPYNL